MLTKNPPEFKTPQANQKTAMDAKAEEVMEEVAVTKDVENEVVTSNNRHTHYQKEILRER